jgi:4-alpha-glucanotransferase
MKANAASVFERRTSGILLHPTSLPGPNGCGDLGPAAYHFIDWLVKAGQTLWQVLPLNPVGAGNSPYQSVSAFAGSPLLVNLESLVNLGWLPWAPDKTYDHNRCDYGQVTQQRMARLRAAWQGFSNLATAEQQAQMSEFCIRQADWLDDYALFMTLDSLHGSRWNHWPTEFAQREPEALKTLRQQAAREIGFWSFVQWQFMCQWQSLRAYAHNAGIFIIGDAPIFVAHHSADVWANAGQYLLDEAGDARVVAGVPPDYFSPTGQRWGNPLYDWTAMQADGYAWWKSRLAHQLTVVDILRLDHFRGFEAHWEIPANEPNAIVGEWRAGPGKALFDAMLDALGPLPLIAEDLGLITQEVTDLRLAYGFPGMRIVQFAFGDSSGNPYLPHNYVPQTIAYTGTHDNNTAVGWWQSLATHEQEAARRYLGPQADLAIHWAMIHAVSQSVASTAIYPFQDVLGLDASHRMNVPGQPDGCWEWRFEWLQVGEATAAELARITHAHGRTPQNF